MTDDQLTRALDSIGIAAEHVALVSLLPLVQVAWADGRIQPRERELILGLGAKHGLLHPGGEAIVEAWLADAPSQHFHATARKVLAHLATRAELPVALDHQAVVGWCWALASAAGGVFGTRMLAISEGELRAIAEIAASLQIHEIPEGWTDLTLSD